MPMKKGDANMKGRLCSVGEMPDEGAKAVDFLGRSVLVYKVNGRPRAIANVRLHLGGPLECDGDKFVCPWHGAEYARVDRRRISGPAPQDARLMVIPTRVEDGVLNYVYGE